MWRLGGGYGSIQLHDVDEDQQEFASPELLQMFELDKQLQQQQRTLRERRLQGNPLLTY